jgi:hypothetical protein
MEPQGHKWVLHEKLPELIGRHGNDYIMNKEPSNGLSGVLNLNVTQRQ